MPLLISPLQPSPTKLLLLLLTLRTVLAFLIPMTGDEAYFILWGRFPDFGYYDHPPMAGWWLSALLTVTDHPAWLRLPSILLPTLIALSLSPLLKPYLSQTQLYTATVLVALAPPHIWNVLYTTDTPLVFFGVFSALFFIRGFLDEQLRFYVLAGLCFAGAALSKYFAVFLGIAYLVATLLAPTKRRLSGLLLIVLLTIPAALLMAWWNSENCWPNILFNLINRNARAGFQWQYPGSYILTLLYLTGFLPLFYASKATQWFSPLHGTVSDKLFWTLTWVPILLFGLLSFGKQIGLHWLLTFVPLILIGIARQLNDRQAKQCLQWLQILALVHYAVFFIFLFLPLQTWENNSRYPEIVWTTQTTELVKAAEITADRHWFTDGYTYAAELSYARDRVTGRDNTYGGPHIGVFGPGSHYARQDDRLTNFQLLDGENFAILLRNKPSLEEYAPYFSSVRLSPVNFAGAHFYTVYGDGFRYEAYRDQVLTQVRDRFYRIPAWLPNCGCFFLERYFP